MQVDPQADGTMVFRFGVEEARADAPAASDTHHAAPAAAASAAAAEVAATAAAAAAAATAAPAPAPEVVSTPAAARHAAPASGGGNGAAAPSAAALQLEDLLHRSLGSDEEEEGRRRNGSSNGASSSSSSVGNGWYQGPASTGPAAGLGPARTIKQRSSGQGATRQQQQQQQRGGQPRGQQHTYLGNGFGGSGGPGGAPQQRAQAGAAPAGDARTLDYSEASVATIVATYDRLCEFAELDEALHLMKQCTRAGRVDVISTWVAARRCLPASQPASPCCRRCLVSLGGDACCWALGTGIGAVYSAGWLFEDNSALAFPSASPPTTLTLPLSPPILCPAAGCGTTASCAPRAPSRLSSRRCALCSCCRASLQMSALTTCCCGCAPRQGTSATPCTWPTC